jgi:DNA-binding NtrC family response regulator
MSENNPSILIVDDEPSLLRMMSMYLGRLGYRVLVASNVEAAREHLSAGRIDAAVLDATLPGTRLDQIGGEILSAGPDVRLLVASGYPVDISGMEAAAPGRVAFLHKPFSPEMLAAVLRRMIGAQEEKL